MTWIKSAGLLLTLGGLAYGGLVTEQRYRSSLRELAAVIRLVERIADRIGTYREPLEEIYRRAAADPGSAEPLRSLYLALPAAGFGGAVEKICSGLGEEAAQAVRELSERLGQTDAEEQVNLCHRCRAALEQELLRKREQCPVKLRLCRTLTLSAMAMVLILNL